MRAGLEGIAYIDGYRFTRALHAGIRYLLTDTAELNRINVIPVADGDTGTNLALTLYEVDRVLGNGAVGHIGDMLARVADAALDGAREAMSEPREGTMLTVIQAFADGLKRAIDGDSKRDFVVVVEHGLEDAREALRRTPEQLDVLRRAGVVDAGGKGFVLLVEGVCEYIRSGSFATAQPRDSAPHDTTVVSEPAADPDYRYCTECLIAGEGIDRRKLREQLNNIGNSVIVAGTHNKAKVHAHVANPDELFLVAEKYGTVSKRKADDMPRQQRSRASPRNEVAIVTDSGGDIPADAFDHLNIHIVPLRVHFGECSYLDNVSLSHEQFFAELKSNREHPTTSQPAPGDFRRLYEFLASHSRDVLGIHLTEKVSGTLQAARAAAERARAGDTLKEILAGIARMIDSTYTYAWSAICVMWHAAAVCPDR